MVVCLLLLSLKFIAHAILIVVDVEQQVKLLRVSLLVTTALCCCDVVEPENQLVEWCVLEKLTTPPVAIVII